MAPFRVALPRPLVAALILALSTLAGLRPEPVAAQAPTTGTLELLWGDPMAPGDTVRTLFTLRTDAGQRIPLRFDAGMRESADGPVSLAGQRVSVRLDGPRLEADGAPAPAARVLELAPSGGVPAPASLTAAAMEARPYITILCKFPNWQELQPVTAGVLATRLNDRYGVNDYWREVSDLRVDPAGAVVGWYVLPKAKEEYVYSSDADLWALTLDCAGAADADVHFPDYQGINFLFNTDIGCCAWGGRMTLELDGATLPYGVTWLYSRAADHQGVIAHEVGHSFGLPHSSGPYGLTYDSPWDVMSMAAAFQVPGTELWVGSHTNAYHKRRLGWIPDDRLFDAPPGDHAVLMAPSARPATAGYLAARLAMPGYSEESYYVEVRGAYGYDAPLPGRGVVIHRVGGGGVSPSNVLDLDGNGDPFDHGPVLDVGESFVDRANGIRITVTAREGESYRVRIVQADYPRLQVDTATRRYQASVTEPVRFIDSVQVGLAGLGPDATWRARVSFGSVEIQTATGGDGEWLRWSLRTAGLPPTTTGAGLSVEAAGRTAFVPLQVTVTGVPELTVYTGQTLVVDSALQGAVSFGGTSIGLTGPGADSAAWTLTTNAPWLQLQQTEGRGPAFAARRRDTSLPAGEYEDSVIVTVPGAAGSPLVIRERFRVMERPTLTATRLRGSGQAREGGLPSPDSVHLQISGPLGAGGQWYATSPYEGHVRFDAFPAPGSGWAPFQRVPGTRAPGVYVAPIHLIPSFSTGDTLTLMDTLVVTPADLALRAYPNHRSATVLGATEFSLDSVLIHPEGPGSADRPWVPSYVMHRLHPHQYFFTSTNLYERTGPAWITYIRVLEGREPGLYVDTIRVAFKDGSGRAALIIDSLTVTGPSRISLGTPGGGARLVRGSTTTRADSATVTPVDPEGGALAWTATSSATWIQIETPTGTGPGRLRWTRTAAGLDAGVHVGTIRVALAATGISATLVDSLTVLPPLAIVSGTARPDGVMGAAYGDSLEVAGGLVPATWSVSGGALPPGLVLDPVTGRVAGTPEADGAYTFTAHAHAGEEETTRELRLRVARPVLALDAVLDRILAGSTLPADHERFLDLLGNRNGRLDIGDVLAWLDDDATTLTADARRHGRALLSGTKP